MYDGYFTFLLSQTRDSGSSSHVSPEAPRSRSASHLSRHSHASTLTNQDPENVSALSTPDVPSPESQTGETSPSFLVSSSPVSPVSRNRQDSVVSDMCNDFKRNRSSTVNSHRPKTDTIHAEPVGRDSRNRTPSHSHSVQSSPRSPRDTVPNSPDSSPRLSMQLNGQKRPGHQRHSVSSVADSRVSTPLFLPHGSKGTKPKDRKTEKTRPPTADTERGFDSGFFGSEGSRISRGIDSPELQRHTLLEPRPLRQTEQFVTESEEEHYDGTSLKPSTKTLPRYWDRERHRRSRLKSLSETDEERGLDTSLSKASTRTPSSQRERRGRRQYPSWSEAEGVRTLEGNITKHASSPDLYRDSVGERTPQRSRLGSSLRSSSVTPSRREIPRKHTVDTGSSASRKAGK